MTSQSHDEGTSTHSGDARRVDRNNTLGTVTILLVIGFVVAAGAFAMGFSDFFDVLDSAESRESADNGATRGALAAVGGSVAFVLVVLAWKIVKAPRAKTLRSGLLMACGVAVAGLLASGLVIVALVAAGAALSVAIVLRNVGDQGHPDAGIDRGQ